MMNIAAFLHTINDTVMLPTVPFIWKEHDCPLKRYLIFSWPKLLVDPPGLAERTEVSFERAIHSSGENGTYFGVWRSFEGDYRDDIY
jgi:hypothetical protein